MIWIKKITRPLLLAVLPLAVIACTVSYKFNGSSINYDKVKTISIADFPIKSEYVYNHILLFFYKVYARKCSNP